MGLICKLSGAKSETDTDRHSCRSQVSYHSHLVCVTMPEKSASDTGNSDLTICIHERDIHNNFHICVDM